MRSAAAILSTAVVAAIFQPPVSAQPVGFRLRPGFAAGVSTYNGDADVQGVGALGRLSVAWESPASRFGAELEGTYHRFTVLVQRCPTCVGCRCTPESPPADVWSGRISAQWHLVAGLGGVYATAGLGLYSAIHGPDAPGRTAVGIDVGLGARHAGPGLFAEIRCLRVQTAATSAWLFPATVGYRL